MDAQRYARGIWSDGAFENTKNSKKARQQERTLPVYRHRGATGCLKLVVSVLDST